MRATSARRLQKFYSSPCEEMHKVSLTTEDGVEQCATLLTIKSYTEHDREGIHAYLDACQIPALSPLLPQLLFFETRPSDLLVYFEPIKFTMRKAMSGMSRDTQWYQEEGLSTFAFLLLSLQLLHANHFIHGTINLDTVFYTAGNLFKLGYFRQAKKVVIGGLTDLQYHKDVRDMGITLICYATLNERQDQVACMNDLDRGKFITERLSQFPELVEVLMAMTRDAIIERISAETAFSMLNRVISPELEEVGDQSLGCQSELHEGKEEEMRQVLNEIQAMVNSRNVVSEDLIKLTLANFRTLHSTLKGTIEGRVKVQSVKCHMCMRPRRTNCTIKLPCEHIICLPCLHSNTLLRRDPKLSLECRECAVLSYIGDMDFRGLPNAPRQIVESVLTQLKSICPTCGKVTTHTNSPLKSICGNGHSICLFCKKDGHTGTCSSYTKIIGI